MTEPTRPVQFSMQQLRDLGAQAENFQAVYDPPAEAEVAPRPSSKKSPAAPAKEVSPKNILALAKARLRDVKAELRRMKALEKERGELERLITAAENKPRAVVRDIKRTAG